MKRLIAIVLLAAGLAACAGKDNTTPPTPLKKFTPSAKVDKVWTADAGGDDPILRLGITPTSDGRRIYTADRGGRVSAYALKNGDRVWTHNTHLKLGGGPAVAFGRVAVAATNGDVAVLDAESGKLLWKKSVGGALIASPAISRNAVVVRAVNGRLTALSAVNGRKLWNVDRQVPRLTLRGTSPPAIAGGVVYAGYDTGKLIAVNLNNGDVKWETTLAMPQGGNDLARLVDLDGLIQLTDYSMYAATYQGSVGEIGLSSGQVLWTRDMSSSTGVEIDDKHVYVTDSHSVVWALSRDDGTPVWQQKAMEYRSLTAPTPYQNVVAAGDFDGHIHFLSKTNGSLVARSRVGGDPILAAPIVAGGSLIVQNSGGDLAALKLTPIAGK
jgi:outer membrane protein assembly factor BamB